MWPSRGFCADQFSFRCTTCPCFDNLELDIFYAGGPQCHDAGLLFPLQLGFEHFQYIS